MFQPNQSFGRFLSKVLKFLLTVSLAAPAVVLAQTNMTIYADSLLNGWSDGSYNCTRNFANASPVYSGSHSISITITNAWGGLQVNHSGLMTTGFANISFWLNGGTIGGQQLQMYAHLSTSSQGPLFHLASPPADAWRQYTISLSSLGVANVTNLACIAIQDSAGSIEPTFYLDDLQLNAPVPPPSIVHFSINANQPIRTADARWFGLNAAMWDGYYDTPTTISLLNQLGTRVIRLPGGSASDDYHWLTDMEDTTNNWQWGTSLANFIHVITNAGVNAQAIITVNYGTGTPQEAAAWVAYCNAATTSAVPIGVDAYGTNWQTAGYWASLRASAPLGTDDGKNFLRISRTTPLGFKYWEIGNEEYGNWEIDHNTNPHDPYTYALRATNYIALMKAVDPTIEIGAVSTPGEDSYANYTNHPAYNSREGVYHNGWTPVMLATFHSTGVTPGFLVHHFYPQSGSDNDAALLQASANWASDAASLRQQITDYIGTGGTNIELLVTENNSDSGPEGKQSTSLVNGLYLADSLAQLMKTEFNSFVWWDLRNGPDTTGDFSPSLYGWRTNGDLGIVGNLNTLYPAFYTDKLMHDFFQAGDTVLTATSDYSLLSAYAVRRQDGSLTVLAINKDPSNTYTGQVAVFGFTPAASGTVYSYGIPQDDAAETNATPALQDIATNGFSGASTNFNYAFPPYSATVLSLSPAPAQLLVNSILPATGRFVFQLQGQTGVPYILQNSTNLLTWTSVSTNTLSTGTINITNSTASSTPAQFWRTVWLP